MDKSKAKALIELHRRRWRSKASDDSIARRAQRTYFGIAMMCVCLAFSMSLLLPKARVIIFPGYFLAAAIACWASWRFRQIRNLLSDSDAKTDSH
jgi:cobalamin biosynthesis protein CobD/CbiB